MVGSSIFLFDDEWSDVVTGFLVMFGVCTVAERKLQGDYTKIRVYLTTLIKFNTLMLYIGKK